MSTVPVVSIFDVKSPSFSSFAVAPFSSYLEFNKICIFSLPLSFITGAISSIMHTFLVAFVLFPELSTTLYIILYSFSFISSLVTFTFSVKFSS